MPKPSSPLVQAQLEKGGIAEPPGTPQRMISTSWSWSSLLSRRLAALPGDCGSPAPSPDQPWQKPQVALSWYSRLPSPISPAAGVCAEAAGASANDAASATAAAVNRIMYVLGPAELIFDQRFIYREVDHRRLPIIVLHQHY